MARAHLYLPYLIFFPRINSICDSGENHNNSRFHWRLGCVTQLIHFIFDNFLSAWIGALYLASGSLFSPICSFISDRFSYRFTAMLGSLATIIGYSLASMSSEIWMMYLTYGLLSGFGHIMIYNSSFMVILQYFVKWRSLAVGFVASAPAIGMLMTQLTQALLSAFGWRWALRAIALLHFLCGLCSTVFVPIDKLKGEICENKSSGRQRETPQSTLLRNRSFWILLTSLFVVYLSYYVPTVHIVSIDVFWFYFCLLIYF